jgi:hypothetical protein
MELMAIIAFFVFFLLPIPHQATNASIQTACVNAIANYRIAAIRVNAENATKFEQIFGRPVSTIQTGECPRAMQLYRWRLRQVRAAIMPAFRAVYAQCVGFNINPRPPTPPQIIAILEQRIAAGCSRPDQLQPVPLVPPWR